MRGLRYTRKGSAWSLQESKCHTADLRHSAVPALCTMSGSCGSMHLATGCNLDVLRKPALSAGRKQSAFGRTNTYSSGPKKAVLPKKCCTVSAVAAHSS